MGFPYCVGVIRDISQLPAVDSGITSPLPPDRFRCSERLEQSGGIASVATLTSGTDTNTGTDNGCRSGSSPITAQHRPQATPKTSSVVPLVVALLSIIVFALRQIVQPGCSGGNRVADAIQRIQSSTQTAVLGLKDIKIF